ncbi:MAG: TauD/TfdA family dioxygenase [Pseudomonadota bacterium]
MPQPNFLPCDAPIGAAVTGVDLALPPDPKALDELERALEHYGVLIFPDQDITPAQQIEFSRCFGFLEPTTVRDARLDDAPEILVVGNTGDQPVTFSPAAEGGELEWHSDHIHRPIPSRASLLYALSVPDRGGDTLFACMYSAYAALPADEQARCDGLRVINSDAGVRAWLARQELAGSDASRYDEPDLEVVHPLVRRHPLTGRKALSFGNQVSTGIVGWERPAAARFIQKLTAHACAERFQYRHRWRKGDAVLWDNRRVLHAGTAYDLNGSPRLMHRTTIRETEALDET